MSEESPMEVDGKWRVRKEISLPTLGFLALQALGMAWMISAAWSGINDVQRAQDRRLEKLERIDSENRLTRLEADSEFTKQLLIRLEQSQNKNADKLDRVLERLPNKRE